MPGEWLAAIWNRPPDAHGPLAHGDRLQRLFTLLQQHDNTLVMTLVQQPQDDWPLLMEDTALSVPLPHLRKRVASRSEAG
jgi:hypothetical protein